MPQVRALTKLFHENVLYQAGDVFEMSEAACKALTGAVEEGVMLVTKKTEAAYAKTQAAARDELDATVRALRIAYEEMKTELGLNPNRGDLVQKILDAEANVQAAEATLAEFDRKAAEQAV